MEVDISQRCRIEFLNLVFLYRLGFFILEWLNYRGKYVKRELGEVILFFVICVQELYIIFYILFIEVVIKFY